MATGIASHPAALPVSARPPSRRWLALAVLCISLLSVALDNTVLNVVLPTAANAAFRQISGALGVAVIGSLLPTRYTDHVTAAAAPDHVPAGVLPSRPQSDSDDGQQVEERGHGNARSSEDNHK